MKKNIKKTHSNWWHLFASASILIAVFCFMASHKNEAQAAPASAVYMSPETRSAQLNESFNWDVFINPGTNEVSAIELHILFDRTRLRANSLTPNIAAGAFPDVLVPAQIDNNAGIATITLGSGSSSWVTITNSIATINFTAIGNGEATVNPAGTRASARGEGSTNVIMSLGEGSVMIGQTYGNADFAALVTDWLQTKSSPADVNSDGTVNAKDLGVMMSNWGS